MEVTDAIQITDGQYTNILKFEANFKQALVISERMIDEELLTQLINETAEQSVILAKPKIVTTLKTESILSLQRQKAISNLSDLFGANTRKNTMMASQDNHFQVRVFLLGFQPQNIAEFC